MRTVSSGLAKKKGGKGWVSEVPPGMVSKAAGVQLWGGGKAFAKKEERQRRG